MNESYEIEGEIPLGFHSPCGLFIKKDSVYLFAGLSDYELNGMIKLPRDFPFIIEWEKVLTEKNLVDFGYTYYNMLYKYSLWKESIFLNQNESGTLRDYIIYQGIARMQELNQPDHVVCSGGINGISFTIVKK